MPERKQLTLRDMVLSLNGVGPKTAENLNRIGILTIGDLLFHLPVRYQDRTTVTAIKFLNHGEESLVEGVIQTNKIIFRGRRSLICRIGDPSGSLNIRFFNFSKSQQQNLVVGSKIQCFGQVRKTTDLVEIIHPEYRTCDTFGKLSTPETLTPVYPLTEGIQQAKISKLIAQAVTLMRQTDPVSFELLPEQIRTTFNLPDLFDTIQNIHQPRVPKETNANPEGRLQPFIRRLAFEELLTQQLCAKRARKLNAACTALKAPSSLLRDRFEKNLKFELTIAQRKVIKEIDTDLKSGIPMTRLLQGDVGSGKTVVAASICTSIINVEHKVAFMAPTELLAEQHFRTLEDWFIPLEVDTILVTGKMSKIDRLNIAARLLDEKPLIAVGTHALFQKDIKFHRLGLTIVDEQHRFGVDQRKALIDKGSSGSLRSHQLVMTATPIPRTLAMTAYAHLNLSVLDSLPVGRKKVATHVMPESRRTEIVKRIGEVFSDGGQVYWVCPLIEESDKLEKKAAVQIAADLSKQLSEMRIGLVHGRLSEGEKDSVMRAFVGGKIDLLVATTVIEVGVDVPNATLMVIENSENLGLSQLHQLRGRVGRSQLEANCILLYKTPLSETARSRLEIMRETTDGFKIAELDLKIRGPGQFLGKRQSGLANFKIANLTRDTDIIAQAESAAQEMIDIDVETLNNLSSRWIAGTPNLIKI